MPSQKLRHSKLPWPCASQNRALKISSGRSSTKSLGEDFGIKIGEESFVQALHDFVDRVFFDYERQIDL